MPATVDPRHQVSKKIDGTLIPMAKVLRDMGKGQTQESQRLVDLAQRFTAFTLSRRAPLTPERKPGMSRTA